MSDVCNFDCRGFDLEISSYKSVFTKVTTEATTAKRKGYKQKIIILKKNLKWYGYTCLGVTLIREICCTLCLCLNPT